MEAPTDTPPGIEPARLEEALRVLAEVEALPLEHPDQLRVQRATAAIYKSVKLRRRAEKREGILAHDRAITAATATGAPGRIDDETQGLPLVSEVEGASAGTLLESRACYVCKDRYTVVDAFYHQLCPSCARENHARRDARTDLTGRRALLTGGRAKIGMHIALRLLRDGAALTITTRFPRDAARRFAQMPDAADWLPRLKVVGVDLRDPRQVVALAEQVAADGPLDILINNAAQTVRRSTAAYAPLVAAERAELPDGPLPELVTLPRGGAPFEVPFRERNEARTRPSGAGAFEVSPAERTEARTLSGSSALEGSSAQRNEARTRPGADPLTVRPGDHWAPTPEALTTLALTAGSASPERAATGRAIDAGGLVPDLHETNSWIQGVGEVDPVELLEVQLCNSTAPFILISRLRSALAASPARRTYVVNVSAMEGQFARGYKGPGHPHTNMAKAALNMLTRTSAEEMLDTDGILMTAVDTGWITDERPHPTRARLAEEGFHAPLDLVDGAARVYDPIVRGEQGEELRGVFLKDYAPAPW